MQLRVQRERGKRVDAGAHGLAGRWLPQHRANLAHVHVPAAAQDMISCSQLLMLHSYSFSQYRLCKTAILSAVVLFIVQTFLMIYGAGHTSAMLFAQG